ncbi:putative fungal-specific transcription factor [Aspergillus lentulus]|nr:putative fungal-specific transcription factor [Aspergillus lentulus]
MSTKKPRDRTTPCCVCRLKRRGCDRQRPVCGRCREAGLSQECSYRPEDMPPRNSSTRSLLPQQLKRLRSLPSPSQSAPLVVIQSAAPSSSTWNGREWSPRRTLQSSREAGPRLRYTLDLFSHRRTQSGSAMYPARGNLQARGQIDVDESSAGESEEKDDAIEVSSSHSEESFHTATRSPMPEFISAESRGAQGSHSARIRQAQERRTGSVKREEEEPIEDRLPVLRHSNLAGGMFMSAVDDVDEEMMDSPADLSKEDADRLVKVYLNLDYVTLPILDIQDFRAAYEAASVAGESTTPSAFHAILNTIFALACLNVEDMGDERASYFFKEGQRLANLFDQYKSIDLLRLYLLQIQYLNAIGDLHTAWALIGSTIRLAQSLRLPFDAKQHGHSRKGRETCRRLWHGVMIMERILALRLGIAPQTPDPLRVPLPTHLDTDYVDVVSSAQSSGPLSAQGDRASIIEFVTACARLYRLVDDVMAWEEEARIRPHACAMKKLLSLDFTRFLKVDGLLHDWNLSLPSSLRSSGVHGTDEHSIVVRQRNILRARYLYLRLRLNRPLVTLGVALTTACKCKSDGQPHIVVRRLGPDSPIALSLVHGASINCVRSALELTELIREHGTGLLLLDTPYDASHGLNPPYWESVDNLYVCGTVFLASFNHTSPFFGDMTDEEDEQCRVLWPCIIDLLDRYQGYRRRGRTNNVAQACSRTLSELAKAVESTDDAAWAVESARLGQDARARFSQRTEMESPIRHRRISGATQTIPDPLGDVPEFPVWMDSLPVDLVG